MAEHKALDVIKSTKPLYVTRFIAAFGVLIYHFLPKSLYSVNSPIIRLGEAVNYFFFISGFVMIVSNWKHLDRSSGTLSFSKADFWVKRIARIFPMYLLALALTIGFSLMVEYAISGIFPRVIFETLGVQRWLYPGSINFPAWSVSCEFFFYFLFPFIIPILLKTSNKKILFFLIVALAANVLVTYLWGRYIIVRPAKSTILNIVNLSICNHPVFKTSVFLAGCFGGFIYMEYKTKIERFKRISIFIVLALTLLAFGIMSLMPTDRSYLIEGGLLTPLYFFITLSLCNLTDQLTRLLSNKVFIFLGEISYGMYILQAPILLFVSYYLNGTHKNGLNSMMQFLFYCLIVIVVSAILYLVFEKPSQKLILNWYRQRNNRLSN